MCDTLTRKNIPEAKFPEFVYKRVQKVGDGKYISPVMGEPMPFGKWLKAPKRDLDTIISKSGSVGCGEMTSLVRILKRKWKTKLFASSSVFTHHHNGMWGSFKHRTNAEMADLASNFVETTNRNKQFPTVVVKCEVKGVVHEALFTNKASYLSSHIKIVEELGKSRYI